MKVRLSSTSLLGALILSFTALVTDAAALSCSCNDGADILTVKDSTVTKSGMTPKDFCAELNGSTATHTTKIGIKTTVTLSGCVPVVPKPPKSGTSTSGN